MRYVVRKNPRFLQRYWKLLQTVISKVFEFMQESKIPLAPEHYYFSIRAFGALGNGFTTISPLTPGSTVDKLSARKDLSPKVYAEFACQWVEAGATIIGGCCEIGPEHISFLCQQLKANGYRPTTLPV